jgi:predicted PurR-regulated permease PerM
MLNGIDPSLEPPTRRNWTTAITFLSLLVIILVINVRMVAPFFLALLMGGILSLLSRPLYARLHGRGWKATHAAGVVTLVVAVTVIVPLIAFAFVAIKQGIAIGQYLSENDTLSFDNLKDTISHWGPVETFVGDTAALETQLKTAVKSGGKAVSAAILAAAGGIPDRALQIVLGLLACFFLLMDGRRLVSWLSDKIPLDWDVRIALFSSFQDTAISVIWATLAAAGAQAALMLITFLLLGVPGAFLAAGATFVFAWIPMIGSTPVWVAGAIYLWTQGAVAKMVAMIALGIVTSIIDNFIRPMVLKGRSDMHPLVSLVAIFGGISMFGIFGVFIGPILAAVLISLLQIWPAVGRRYGLTFERKT